jgi:glutamyl-tRNA synthetase
MFHIGSARTALFNWLYARHTGGTFILRIEDTDAARNKPEYVAVIFQAMKWLGMDWDEGPQPDGTVKGDKGPYLQSQRGAIYKRYVDKLLAEGKAYESDGAVKFRTPKTPIVVPDLICGHITFDRTNEPDLVIQRKDGSPVFHLVNVVDDIEMGVTHVIRGEDHLSNTHKHLALIEAFGATAPQYAHIPLILNPNGSKMSKRDVGASIADYEREGYLPEAVRNYLCLLGWSLFWINGEYMRAATVESLVPLAHHILAEHGVKTEGVDPAYFQAALAIVKEKIKLGRELPEWMGYFFTDDFSFDEAAAKKVFTPEGLAHLAALQPKLAGLDAAKFTATELENEFKALAAANGQKVGAYIHPARLATSGRPVGPSLYHLLEVLGRERVLNRIDRALKKFATAK